MTDNAKTTDWREEYTHTLDIQAYPELPLTQRLVRGVQVMVSVEMSSLPLSPTITQTPSP